jgi:hypothetical protein
MITKTLTAVSGQEILRSEKASMGYGCGRPIRPWAVPASPSGRASNVLAHYPNSFQYLTGLYAPCVGGIAASSVSIDQAGH